VVARGLIATRAQEASAAAEANLEALGTPTSETGFAHIRRDDTAAQAHNMELLAATTAALVDLQGQVEALKKQLAKTAPAKASRKKS
jgi:hypothetical protein